MLRGWTDLAKHFTLPKTQNRLEFHEQTFEFICNELRWQFTPSAPATAGSHRLEDLMTMKKELKAERDEAKAKYEVASEKHELFKEQIAELGKPPVRFVLTDAELEAQNVPVKPELEELGVSLLPPAPERDLAQLEPRAVSVKSVKIEATKCPFH